MTLSALPWFQAAAIEIAPALVAGGQQAHAFALLREAEKSVRKLGLPLAENHLLCITGVVEYLRGNPDRAARLLAASRRVAGAADRSSSFVPLGIGRCTAITSRWFAQCSALSKGCARVKKDRPCPWTRLSPMRCRGCSECR